MAKGKKGKKGKKDAEPTEPPHDPGWERSVQSGRWERPPDALPDASSWPTWGALRERILTSCKEIKITWSNHLRDAFPSELIKLSPPELVTLDLKGSGSLTRFMLSPPTSCPRLTTLDLSACAQLNHVLIQSLSLETVVIAKCATLNKALIQCKNLKSLVLEGCETLDTLMLWSDEIKDLELMSCTNLRVVELYCPQLFQENLFLPKLREIPPPEPPKHPPIVTMLKDMYADKARHEAEVRERDRQMSTSNTVFARTFHKCAP
mmetsp:Transcript_17803/g.34028  ORF Transcript_17803/g.34028 Transcript_17803/m.34028 type:complete len:263 (-) Transcript_17803:359-1147(-)|eukprot:CAMPEP_0114253100 /NCGR_PEP_ID=MMETSP0058-20121206/16207_1 /TAXON_ID=36894 /ORGANISM="Pyramimonas parkeae, CCMP726" /LENGTH=262 /DNA_ID=CAMNT_0001367113 /DNA_START=94 /DNA_END=882 /DNA_ORIENTATION=-